MHFLLLFVISLLNLLPNLERHSFVTFGKIVTSHILPVLAKSVHTEIAKNGVSLYLPRPLQHCHKVMIYFITKPHIERKLVQAYALPMLSITPNVL